MSLREHEKWSQLVVSSSENRSSDAAGEPPHLAMCADTEGNEFMLTRKRH